MLIINVRRNILMPFYIYPNCSWSPKRFKKWHHDVFWKEKKLSSQTIFSVRHVPTTALGSAIAIYI